MQHRGLRAVAPAPGRCVVTGFCAFAPGAAASAESVRVVAVGATADEVPANVRPAASWADGSLKLAEVTFVTDVPRAGDLYVWLEWGPDVRRALPGPAELGALPQPLYFEEAEVPSPDFDLGAGMMLVRVERHPDLWYYACYVPAAAIIGLLVWRKVKLSR